MCTRRLTLLLLLAAAGSPIVAADLPASRLRLVPFPKEVEMLPGVFALDRPLSLAVPTERAELLAAGLRRELDRAGCGKLEIASGDAAHAFSLAAGAERATQRALPEQMPAEGYVLEVRPEGIACNGADAAGLYYGMQTLCQLIRANRRDKCLPCLRIRDWPSLQWRCYQDDLTRGPSSTLDTLQQHVELGSELKMNLFTYYMEYQFAFKKHPVIGPPDGSLVPEDLAAIVSHAKARHVDVLGNQQSFGHFSRILAHPEYAALRETEGLLCPVKEESYQLLDDLYSEVCPLLPFPMFNVCCDETWGLGSGPSKTLAEQIGVGGVYVGHIRRVHDLLRDKYSKRMMMWGDIILQHPEHLDQVPKDTVMLTWGYGAQDSFEDQIVPFARSGYEFFVCPGISNWSRILPEFGVATLNIRNFVRDGVKHGTLGMLNTEWEDDGEALQGTKWHGYAWGAECAWNGSTTDLRDFNRRIGAVLFGEPGDHFGQAVEMLAQTHPLPGMKGMNNARFWENDFLPRQTVSNTRTAAERLLQIVQPAIKHLQACREDAVANAPLLDAFLLGARRMELIGRRMRDGLRAAEAYASACETADRAKRQALLEEVATLVSATRRAHAELGNEFKRLWLSESKPYALDWTMSRYANLDAWYRDLEARVADAMKRAERGEGLPTPEELGLALPTVFSRRTRPHGLETVPLPSAAWAEPAATHRLGLTIGAGTCDRWELPVELDLHLPGDLGAKPVRAFWSAPDQPAREILAQLDSLADSAKTRLTLLVPGPVPAQSRAEVHVYLGLPHAAAPLEDAASTSNRDETLYVLENNRVRLLLGTEGAHVYGWEVKAANDRDLTMPGLTGWSGFADLGGAHRSAPNQVTCTARGPALVRYTCTDPLGMVKTVSLFGGTSWVEVELNQPVEYYFDFDDPRCFAADGPAPGDYLFPDGKTGPVGRASDGVSAQVKAGPVHWAIKSNSLGLALGMTTPEVAANYVVAPGAGAGGVGIENSPAACHFVTFAGLMTEDPHTTMTRLHQTLCFRNQPEVVLYALEERGRE